jgi:hypothetical protein
MKKYLPQLSEDELRYICSFIPYQVTIEYFKKNPKEFTQIRKGFRPNKLSKKETELLLINNCRKSFISTFIEQNIKTWLSQIEVEINEYLKKGETTETAYIQVLSQSQFAQNVRLYFKLVNKDIPDELVGFYSALIAVVKKFNDKNQEYIGKDLIKKFETDLKTLKTDVSRNLKVFAFIDNKLKKVISDVDEIKHTLASYEQVRSTVKNDREQINHSTFAA